MILYFGFKVEYDLVTIDKVRLHDKKHLLPIPNNDIQTSLLSPHEAQIVSCNLEFNYHLFETPEQCLALVAAHLNLQESAQQDDGGDDGEPTSPPAGSDSDVDYEPPPLEEKEVEDTSDDESDVERVVSKTISNKKKSKKCANQLCVKYVKDGKVHGDGASFYMGTGNGAEAQTRAAAAKLS